MAHDVFISYSSKDKAIADAVCATLETYNVRCWIAPRDVTPGEPFARCIIDGINNSRLMVLVFSTSSNSSQHVLREVERAASKGMSVVPFRVDAAKPGPDIEFLLSNVHWLDAMTPPMEARLAELTGIVLRLLGRPEQAAAFRTVAADGGTTAGRGWHAPQAGNVLERPQKPLWRNPWGWLVSRKGNAIPVPKMVMNVLISLCLSIVLLTIWLMLLLYIGKNSGLSSRSDAIATLASICIVFILPLIISWAATYPARQGMIRWRGILVSICIAVPGYLIGFLMIVIVIMVMSILNIPTSIFI